MDMIGDGEWVMHKQDMEMTNAKVGKRNARMYTQQRANITNQRNQRTNSRCVHLRTDCFQLHEKRDNAGVK